MEEQIARCRVKAERDGIVTSLPVKEMSVIQAGETAAVINSREGMKAEADVLTNIAPYIKEGEPVEVTLQLRGRDEPLQVRWKRYMTMPTEEPPPWGWMSTGSMSGPRWMMGKPGRQGRLRGQYQISALS